MAEQLKPQFFVVRDDGSMVPLLAMDELPQILTIRGVSRLLSPQDLAGMTCVGKFESRHSVFDVETVNQKAKNVSSNATNTVSDLPLPGRKEYCSHWIKKGECDFVQRGCLFKHEMPMELGILKAIGFSDIPLWYRQKHSVASLRAVEGSGAARLHTRLANDWRSSPNAGASTLNSSHWSSADNKGARTTTTRNKPCHTSTWKSPPTKTRGPDESPMLQSSTGLSQKLSSKSISGETRVKKEVLNIFDEDVSVLNDQDSFAPLTPEKGYVADNLADCASSSRTADYEASGSSVSSGVKVAESHDSNLVEQKAEKRVHQSSSSNQSPEENVADADSESDIEIEIARREAARIEKDEREYAALVAAAKAAKKAKEGDENVESALGAATSPTSACSPVGPDSKKNEKRKKPKKRMRGGKRAKAARERKSAQDGCC